MSSLIEPISLALPKEFFCPIKGTIFENPVTTKCCNTNFEKEALEEQFQLHNRCPGCRKKQKPVTENLGLLGRIKKGIHSSRLNWTAAMAFSGLSVGISSALVTARIDTKSDGGMFSAYIAGFSISMVSHYSYLFESSSIKKIKALMLCTFGGSVMTGGIVGGLLIGAAKNHPLFHLGLMGAGATLILVRSGYMSINRTIKHSEIGELDKEIPK
jgi:hypothetical protein